MYAQPAIGLYFAACARRMPGCAFIFYVGW